MLKYLGDSSKEVKSNPEVEPAPPLDQQQRDDLFEATNMVDTVTAEAVKESDNDEDLLEVLKKKNEGLEYRVGYLERIVKVSQILNSTLTLEPLLKIIIQSATELTDTEACSIMLMDRNSGELRFAEATGGVSKSLKQMSVPLENSIAGWVVRTDKPFLIRDVRDDPRWNAQVDRAINFETRSILGIPLKVREKVIGVLEVVNKRAETGEKGFSQDDIQITTTLASQAAIAIENARLLDELQKAYRELSELDQIKGDFVSIAAHELRTPLAVILGYAGFLKENLTGQASEQLEIVLNSAMRLRALIDDMVNLHHIETNNVALDYTVFSLRDMLLEVIKEFSELIKGNQQICTRKFTPDDNPLNIEADRQKIYLIFANLISNAIKFTPQGGRIHISVELKGYKYWVNVIDTGIGIPKDACEKVFDQFYQVEPSLTRKYQGMGLGLSIAKGMVEVHKGRIWVQSVEGKGSNFNVVLPSAPDIETT